MPPRRLVQKRRKLTTFTIRQNLANKHNTSGSKKEAAKGTSKNAKKLLRKEPLRCFYCKKTPKEAGRLTSDHVVPKSKGGSNDRYNQVLACRACNTAKGSKTQKEFLADAKES